MKIKTITYAVLAMMACIIVAVIIWPTNPNNETPPPTKSSTTLTQPGILDKSISSASSSGKVEKPIQQSALDQLKSWFSPDDPAWAWAKVDIKAVQAALPDNLYWEMAAPTNDPLLLDKREDQKKYWEKQYSKILSGTAAIPEVHAYYEYQQQVSTDFLAFAEHLLTHYANKIPERDAGLLNFSKNLHSSRLKEIPGELEQALIRSEAHEKRKNEWLANKEAFEAALEAKAKTVTTN